MTDDISHGHPPVIVVQALVTLDRPFVPWGCVETVYLKSGETYTFTLETDPAVTLDKVRDSIAKCSLVSLLLSGEPQA